MFLWAGAEIAEGGIRKLHWVRQYQSSRLYFSIWRWDWGVVSREILFGQNRIEFAREWSRAKNAILCALTDATKMEQLDRFLFIYIHTFYGEESS